MNKSELTFSAILVPLDYVVVFLAGLLAYGIRFGSVVSELRPVIYEMPLKEFLPILLFASLLWVIVFVFSGLYSIKSTRKMVEEITKIVLACSTAVLVIIIVIFFQRELFSSRFIVLSGWILSIVFIGIERFFVRSFQRRLLKKGIGSHRIAVIGNEIAATRIIRTIQDNPALGYKIVEHIQINSEEDIAKIKHAFESSLIDEIIQADSDIAKPLILKIIDLCNEYHVTFKYVANLFETSATNIAITPLADIPVIELKRTPLDGWGKIFKRAFDIVFSTIFLILFSPFFLVIGILIKIDSPGPMFVGLERVGRKGKIFTLYKFRSMIVGAHGMKKELTQYNERSDGPLFKMKNDPRITRLGKFLRASSIDELPQLWNVLKSKMSLVGPRPHEPEEVSKYQKHHKTLLTIKPGMTGMAQVSGRSDLNFEEEAKLDVYYVENWSMILDLQLIFRTTFVLMAKRSAA
ncbi:sugar transferase [Patescibacteria group bacterium]|nr:sugar transferase [Patescibacteria group bacterium]